MTRPVKELENQQPQRQYVIMCHHRSGSKLVWKITCTNADVLSIVTNFREIWMKRAKAPILISIQENAFENVVGKMSAILSKHQYFYPFGIETGQTRLLIPWLLASPIVARSSAMTELHTDNAQQRDRFPQRRIWTTIPLPTENAHIFLYFPMLLSAQQGLTHENQLTHMHLQTRPSLVRYLKQHWL